MATPRLVSENCLRYRLRSKRKVYTGPRAVTAHQRRFPQWNHHPKARTCHPRRHLHTLRRSPYKDRRAKSTMVLRSGSYVRCMRCSVLRAALGVTSAIEALHRKNRTSIETPFFSRISRRGLCTSSPRRMCQRSVSISTGRSRPGSMRSRRCLSSWPLVPGNRRPRPEAARSLVAVERGWEISNFNEL